MADNIQFRNPNISGIGQATRRPSSRAELEVNEIDLTKRPILMDYEVRSRVELSRCGGCKYAQDESTSVMGMAARMPDGVMLHWTPSLPYPLSVEQCWPTEDCPFERPEIIVSNSERTPDVMMDWVSSGHPIAAHNAYAFDSLIWRFTLKHDEPKGGWIDTMFLARRAALPGSLEQCGQYLCGTGKDKSSALTLRLAKPLPNGMFIPLNSSNMMLVMQYCGKDVLIEEAIYEYAKYTLREGFEAKAMVQNRIRGLRGLPGDFNLATTLLPLWRSRIVDSVEEAVRMTAHLPENERITLTKLRSPKFLVEWLRFPLQKKLKNLNPC